nr:nucleotide exchange factor GrpE [Actinocatenispora thailandica]
MPPAAGGTGPREDEEQEERIVVRDRRRIDPNGTSPRGGTETAAPADAEPAAADAEPAAAGTSEPTAAPDAGEVEKLSTELAERTADLKRVVAEYANYRRRVERDRNVAAEQATGAVLASLLPVLDDLDRAREHGDLVGPFGAVADQLVSALTKAGLTPYGEAGDPFDPMHHEAVAHSLSPDVTEPTCVMVMRRGYRHGERMLRPAMVAVADPDPDAPPAEAATESGKAADAGDQKSTDESSTDGSES